MVQDGVPVATLYKGVAEPFEVVESVPGQPPGWRAGQRRDAGSGPATERARRAGRDVRRAAPEQRAADHPALGTAGRGDRDRRRLHRLCADARARGGAALRPRPQPARVQARGALLRRRHAELGRRRHQGQHRLLDGRRGAAARGPAGRDGRRVAALARTRRDGRAAERRGSRIRTRRATRRCRTRSCRSRRCPRSSTRGRASSRPPTTIRSASASTTIRSTSGGPGGGIYYLSSLYANGSRVGRITRLLEAEIARHGRVSRAAMARIQSDVTLVDAQVLEPFIERAYRNATSARRAGAAGRARCRPGARRGGAAAARLGREHANRHPRGLRRPRRQRRAEPAERPGGRQQRRRHDLRAVAQQDPRQHGPRDARTRRAGGLPERL